MKQAILLLVLGLFILWHGLLVAEGTDWRTNTHLLPQYCKDRAGGSFERWQRTFGEAFIHMHHYCDGIYAELNAKTTINKLERDRLLGLVTHQMGYVSSSCKTGCAIYPDLHTRWGWALSQQGHIAEAILHYQLAIQAKRDYTLAYARLSELYLEANQTDEARKILESGLKARPNSSALKRRLKKLESSE